MQSRMIGCPKCGKSTRYDESNPDRPFCSERCKIHDTAAWATEDYAVPGEAVDTEGMNPFDVFDIDD